MLLLFSVRVAECFPFKKELYIRLTVRVTSERLLVCVCFFLVSVLGWDVGFDILLVSDHCRTFYFDIFPKHSVNQKSF